MSRESLKPWASISWDRPLTVMSLPWTVMSLPCRMFSRRQRATQRPQCLEPLGVALKTTGAGRLQQSYAKFGHCVKRIACSAESDAANNSPSTTPSEMFPYRESGRNNARIHAGFGDLPCRELQCASVFQPLCVHLIQCYSCLIPRRHMLLNSMLRIPQMQ